MAKNQAAFDPINWQRTLYWQDTLKHIIRHHSLRYYGLHFLKLQFKLKLSDLWTIKSKRFFAICYHAHPINYYFYILKTFSNLILILKVKHFKIRIKLIESWVVIWVGVFCNNLKYFCAHILNWYSCSLVCFKISAQ